MKNNKVVEMEIKERVVGMDILKEQIALESEGRFDLGIIDKITGKGNVTLDNHTTIVFTIDSKLKITVIGGDRVAHGEWYDLEKDDEYLIECAEKFQKVLDKIKEKRVKFSYEGIHRVYPAEATEIIEKREILGRFYERTIAGWTGIDNTTGDAWTEDFETLEECIDWLME